MRLFPLAWWRVPALGVALVAAAACSKATVPADDVPASSSGGPSHKDGGGTMLPPGVTDDGGGGDGSTAGPDGGIQGPTFDLTKIASIQGTFVTDQTGLNGINSNATVTWSFKMDKFSDLSQTSGTANWNVTATNVVGGMASDFPPDVDVPMTYQNVAPKAEFNALTPNYVLVQSFEGKVINDFFYYRRTIGDNETNPPDKPHNVTYTVTLK
jgi:hypothetical protein